MNGEVPQISARSIVYNIKCIKYINVYTHTLTYISNPE